MRDTRASLRKFAQVSPIARQLPSAVDKTAFAQKGESGVQSPSARNALVLCADPLANRLEQIVEVDPVTAFAAFAYQCVYLTRHEPRSGAETLGSRRRQSLRPLFILRRCWLCRPHRPYAINVSAAQEDILTKQARDARERQDVAAFEVLRSQRYNFYPRARSDQSILRLDVPG